MLVLLALACHATAARLYQAAEAMRGGISSARPRILRRSRRGDDSATSQTMDFVALYEFNAPTADDSAATRPRRSPV